MHLVNISLSNPHRFDFNSTCMHHFRISTHIEEAYNNEYNTTIRESIDSHQKNIQIYNLHLAKICSCSPEEMFSFFTEKYQLSEGHTHLSDFSVLTMKRFLETHGISSALYMDEIGPQKDLFHACLMSVFEIKKLHAELTGYSKTKEVHEFLKCRDTSDVGPSDVGMVASKCTLDVGIPASTNEFIVNESAAVSVVRSKLKHMNRRIKRILERNDEAEIDWMYTEELAKEERVFKKRAAKMQRVE